MQSDAQIIRVYIWRDERDKMQSDAALTISPRNQP